MLLAYASWYYATAGRIADRLEGRRDTVIVRSYTMLDTSSYCHPADPGAGHREAWASLLGGAGVKEGRE